MEVTNIQDAPQKESVAWAFARWFAVWLVLYTAVGILGGLFSTAPKAIPAGMAWENAMDASSSTFYILRGGAHLILELNPHSQRLLAMLFTAMAVVFMFLCSQALQGKLKNRRKELLPPWQQMLTGVLCLGMVVFMLWYGIGNLMKKEVLDFDPAADSVTLNGEYLSSLKQVTGFRSYITHGSRGSINYHIVMERAGDQPLQIGGGSPHSDVEQMAAYLNGYLMAARQAQP